jgi:hypothetical protein
MEDLIGQPEDESAVFLQLMASRFFLVGHFEPHFCHNPKAVQACPCQVGHGRGPQHAGHSSWLKGEGINVV